MLQDTDRHSLPPGISPGTATGRFIHPLPSPTEDCDKERERRRISAKKDFKEGVDLWTDIEPVGICYQPQIVKRQLSKVVFVPA